MMGQNYMALRLSFLKHQLSNMIQGYFGNKSGIPVVYITKDPSKPEVTTKHILEHRITTEKGQFYSAQVKSYLNLKSEFKELEAKWSLISKLPIPDYKFPLEQTNGINGLDYDFFLNAKAYQNTLPNKTPVRFDGNTFRSKNEVFVAKELKNLRLPYKVEPSVTFRQGTYDYPIATPDLIVGVEAANKSLYIEVVGGFGLEGYDNRSLKKTVAYQLNGYQDMRDIIMIYLSDNMDSSYIRGKILAALDLISPPL